MFSDHNGSKIEINNRNKNNTFLNNPWVKGEVSREIKNNTEPNENASRIYENLGVTNKAMLTGKFIELNVYIRK